MKILEINKFHYLRRGAERHMLDVIDLLESKGHEVAVFSMRHPANLPSKWEKFFVNQVGYNADDSTLWQKIVGIGRIFWSFEARRKIKALLREFRPGIVHLHNIYHQISPSILGPLKESGAKIIMTVHDYHLVSPDKDEYYDCIGKKYWKFLFVKKYSFFKRLILVVKMYWERMLRPYDAVDVFIAPSRFVKDVLVRGGVDEKKIAVIPHFISRGEKSSEPFQELPGKYALYFGLLSKEKGVDELVCIFDALRVPLVLAGTCESGFDLPKSEWVKYVGQQNQARLDQLIENASCIVSGSTLPETFGLIALEAIAFGKPFFGLKSGAYGEIIENGKNGFLSDDFEGLQKSLKNFFDGKISFDKELIKKQSIEEYGAENFYERFLEITRA